MNRHIAKSAHDDRKNQLIEQFNGNPEDKNKKGLWKAVKDLKRTFTPQFVQMKNQNGTYVRVTQRAQTIAEYLEDVHWKNNVDAGT